MVFKVAFQASLSLFASFQHLWKFSKNWPNLNSRPLGAGSNNPCADSVTPLPSHNFLIHKTYSTFILKVMVPLRRYAEWTLHLETGADCGRHHDGRFVRWPHRDSLHAWSEAKNVSLRRDDADGRFENSIFLTVLIATTKIIRNTFELSRMLETKDDNLKLIYFKVQNEQRNLPVF